MVALGYSGWAAAMGAVYSSDQVRAAANALAANATATATAGFVPVATLAEADDAGIDVTEPPAPRAQTPAVVSPGPLAHADKAKLTAAAFRATKAFPGPIGALISETLTSWAEWGFRYGATSRIARLVDAVMAVPLPDPEPATAAA